ncbi:MAG: DUF1553 domain-containing protein [Planctomycetes bacterium]|nr:DUF1553 domain-containing protein [Planctomycetota bacterium]
MNWTFLLLTAWSCWSPFRTLEGDVEPTLAVYPAEVRLDHGADQQRIVVIALDPQGIARDVTADAAFALENEDLAQVIDGVVSPRHDGDTNLIVRFSGVERSVPLHVMRSDDVPPVSFHRDVLPILTRNGCNAGGCHGSAAGKNGFRLSLFGFDPKLDHARLTREEFGRRLDTAHPDRSLMLQKATASVSHKGGQLFEPGSRSYDELLRWIEAGAPLDEALEPALTGIEVLPREVVLKGKEERLQLTVRAQYSDGSDRDVTRFALLSSSNDLTAAIDGRGRVRSGERGEAFVMARFGPYAEVTQVLVLPERDDFTWSEPAATNPIDAFVLAKLEKLRYAPAPLCDDATFVRRLYVDVLNRMPTVEETLAFLADEGTDKRERLIDALVELPEYADVQALQWAEVLKVDRRRMEDKGVFLFTRWLRESFAAGRTVDQVLTDILTTNGSHFEEPTASYYLAEGDAKVMAENLSQVFLGVRIQCAQCHNHPFERWTMDDYYGFAAFFAQIGRKTGEDPRERIIYDRGGGDMRHGRDGSVVPPKFLGGAVPEIPRGTDRRAVLAQWVTSKENPFFARNLANRVWARLNGRGLVDPPDDFRVSNPASHPALLEHLAQELIAADYDTRVLVKAICRTQTYQRATPPGDVPASAFAGMGLRRLSAETLADAIDRITGVPTKYAGVPSGASAMLVLGGQVNNRLLELFGRPERETVCTCERRSETTLGQALHLINGDTVSTKLARSTGHLQEALRAKEEPAHMLETLWLGAYSRRPSEDESKRWLAYVSQAEDGRAAWEDVYWAVLNSEEFLFQH